MYALIVAKLLSLPLMVTSVSNIVHSGAAIGITKNLKKNAANAYAVTMV